MKSDLPADLRRTPLTHLIGCALLSAFAIFSGGCANSYDVRVKAVATPAAPTASQSYRFGPAAEGDEGTLRHREAATFVRSALAAKGLTEAAEAQHADLIISLDFGVGGPRSRRELVSEPVYVYLPGRYRYERIQAGTDRNGNPIYQTVTVQEPPRTEFAGYSEYWITVTTYEKFLRLKAVENKTRPAGQVATELWQVDITSDGESKDIRKALPILAAASTAYVGQDSKGPQRVRLKDTEQGLAVVKKGT